MLIYLKPSEYVSRQPLQINPLPLLFFACLANVINNPDL